MYQSRVRVGLLLACALIAGGCGDDPEPITPPDPIPSITEEFTGTLNPFSARTHAFNVQNAGTVSVAVSELDPDTTVIGLLIGTLNGVVCQTAVSTENAVNMGILNALASSAGTLCARVYDSSENGLPAAVPYKLTITHY
jgi:hypothetical protein